MTWDQIARGLADRRAVIVALSLSLLLSGGTDTVARSDHDDLVAMMRVPVMVDGAWVPPARARYQSDGGGYEQAAYDACARYGCDGAWLYSTLMCESGGNPNAVGPHGEVGVMQFMPSTAYAFGPIDPWDPYASIDLAAQMFSEGLSYHWLCA